MFRLIYLSKNSNKLKDDKGKLIFICYINFLHSYDHCVSKGIDNFLPIGVNSGLHIIIFDEIDAICKTRGSVAGNTGVNDTVVNQLLSKIDGVDQLNNILVIGKLHFISLTNLESISL